VDPRSGLVDVENRKFLTLPVVRPLASRYTDCAIPAPKGAVDTEYILHFVLWSFGTQSCESSFLFKVLDKETHYQQLIV
jgi:hypothetical protein